MFMYWNSPPWSGNTLDITKDCIFEWYQEPASCCAFLEVSDTTGDFVDDETITGQDSGATATVFSSYIDGGRVYVTNVSGTFQTGETITGSSSNQTATIDSFVAERSYPNNIIQGTFPDSIISKDISNYLEWESSGEENSFIGKIQINIPYKGLYILSPIFGVGTRIDKNVSERSFGYSHSLSNAIIQGSPNWATWDEFDCVLPTYYPGIPTAIVEVPTKSFSLFSIYQAQKGTFRWRIHRIRVLKILY